MNIPERLLIHSCAYAAPSGYDRDGNPTMSAPVTLAHVRIEPVIATAQATEGEAADDKLTLYYAPYISTPAVIPEPLARVTWNGNEYTVRSVQPCYTYGGDAVHHYEAALV